MTIHELETPALLIDIAVMERNLHRMADYAQQNQLRLRPHTKTHKIPALGKRQMELGAVGLTVAKVGEAEVMADATQDLLVAYPTVGRTKLDRLLRLPAPGITMSLDSLEVAQGLSEAAVAAHRAVDVLVEIDAGLHRVGVRPEMAGDLAAGVTSLPALRFAGIAFYPGQIKMLDAAGLAEIERVRERVEAAIASCQARGLECGIISAGSTPTWAQSTGYGRVNEIRPGTYIFNDRNTVNAGACRWEDCAASILVTVVSTAVDGQAIIDGGSKTFSSDRLSNSTEVTFGKVAGADQARFTKMNEEHGFIDIRGCQRRFVVGERLHVIPNHVCVAVNLHETIYAVEGERVIESWKVEGRGKLS